MTALSVQGCGRCEYCHAGNTQQCRNRAILGMCTSGAMADYCIVDAEQTVPLREGLSHPEGSLVEPLAVSSRCMRRACGVGNGDRVIVSGCGIIGLLSALVARARGAEVTVAGIEADRAVRLRTAQSLGFATIVVGEEAPLAEQLIDPVDIFVEASGAPAALSSAPDCLKSGGLIGIVATYPTDVELSATNLVRAEQRVHTSFGSTREDYEQAMDHLVAGDIPVADLTETYPLDKAISAFDASIEKRTPKAVILPQVGA